MERKTVTKWFFVWDYELEEKWINEMCLNGWKLVDTHFITYTFERCEPGEYTFKIELLGDQDDSYEELLEESGIETVGKFFRWRYYARRSELGHFELFNDIDSKVDHIDRIIKLLKVVCVANITIGLVNSSRGIGWINLLCAIVLAYSWGRFEGVKSVLLKERDITE